MTAVEKAITDLVDSLKEEMRQLEQSKKCDFAPLAGEEKLRVGQRLQLTDEALGYTYLARSLLQTAERISNGRSI